MSAWRRDVRLLDPHCGPSHSFLPPAPQVRRRVRGAASRASPEMPASIRPEEVVGRWGYGSYHNEGDRARTEAAARGQCGQPVVMNRGPGGGVMMYLADSAQLQELGLKGGPGGRNFIDRSGPARRPAGSRSRGARRSRYGSALDESGSAKPLRHRRLCALRGGGRGAPGALLRTARKRWKPVFRKRSCFHFPATFVEPSVRTGCRGRPRESTSLLVKRGRRSPANADCAAAALRWSACSPSARAIWRSRLANVAIGFGDTLAGKVLKVARLENLNHAVADVLRQPGPRNRL